jgi:hypothetical protein
MEEGRTTLVVKGVINREWIKTKRSRVVDKEAIYRDVSERVLPIAHKTFSGPSDKELLNLITLTDTHIGMRAWLEETGNKWDLKIAREMLVNAVAYLIDKSPTASTCVLANLGDFMHQDGLDSVTTRSKHPLDSDGRYPQIVEAAVEIITASIELALAKHERVLVLIAEGNHDPAGSVWLRTLIRVLYKNEPRVTVIENESAYYVYQHGKTFLGWHHGHLQKFLELPLTFAAKFSRLWGRTTKRYVHTGHLHHKHEKEFPGVTMVQHPTIAASDSHSTRSGYVSDREMTSITYSSRYGQVFKTTVCPEMLK